MNIGFSRENTIPSTTKIKNVRYRMMRFLIVGLDVWAVLVCACIVFLFPLVDMWDGYWAF